MARSPISVSLRWTVFQRDGFTCRYCGKMAGTQDTELVIDHIISVADGGDNGINNLLTACRSCNAGKGARSLKSVPVPESVVLRTEEAARTAEELGNAIKRTLAAREDNQQQIVNLKCTAYCYDSVKIAKGEVTTALKLIREFGAGPVLDWYSAAARADVDEMDAIRYVCGCAKNERGESDERVFS